MSLARGRQAEILLRFAMRLASLEVGGSGRQLQAARQALLLEQAHALAAVRALAAAERRAARETTGRTAMFGGQPRPPALPHKRRRRPHRSRPPSIPKPGS